MLQNWIKRWNRVSINLILNDWYEIKKFWWSDYSTSSLSSSFPNLVFPLVRQFFDFRKRKVAWPTKKSSYGWGVRYSFIHQSCGRSQGKGAFLLMSMLWLSFWLIGFSYTNDSNGFLVETSELNAYLVESANKCDSSLFKDSCYGFRLNPLAIKRQFFWTECITKLKK